MKADVTRQMVRFMETDLPEKHQIDLTVPQKCGERAVLSMDHVVVTGFGFLANVIFGNVNTPQDCDIPTDSLAGPNTPEFVENPNTLKCAWSGLNETVTVDRARLIKILSALTSDFVKLRIGSYYPLLIKGEIGEEEAGAALAPYIENE